MEIKRLFLHKNVFFINFCICFQPMIQYRLVHDKLINLRLLELISGDDSFTTHRIFIFGRETLIFKVNHRQSVFVRKRQTQSLRGSPLYEWDIAKHCEYSSPICPIFIYIFWRTQKWPHSICQSVCYYKFCHLMTSLVMDASCVEGSCTCVFDKARESDHLRRAEPFKLSACMV